MNKKELVKKVKSLEKENGQLKMLLANSVQESTIKNSKEIALRYMEKYGFEMQEHFVSILLDGKHKVIEDVLVTKGTLNRSLVHPREVFAPAIEKRAAAIIILHNHPSGGVDPSTQDINVTKRLVEAGDILGIKVLDHVIIGKNKFFSFVDEDLM